MRRSRIISLRPFAVQDIGTQQNRQITLYIFSGFWDSDADTYWKKEA
jgi:hypothetical protein